MSISLQLLKEELQAAPVAALTLSCSGHRLQAHLRLLQESLQVGAHKLQGCAEAAAWLSL